MNTLLFSLAIFVAYLMGSIPTAVWYGRKKFGLDIREHGSGNAGATNTFRVLGKRAGILVLIVDILKGLTATSLAVLLLKLHVIEPTNLINVKILLGVIAVVGHIFPVFVNFKGGKGVATLAGMAIAIDYPVAILCVAVFLIIVLATKYVSLGSILGVLTFSLAHIIGPFKTSHPLLLAFGVVLFLAVVYTHRKNVNRLINGEENKTYLIKIKRKNK